MSKLTILKIINTIFFIVMVVQVTTGLGQRYFGHSLFIYLRGIHFLNGMLLILFFVLHLKFNWGWISSNIMRGLSK